MTKAEINEACEKFCTYLQANGQRPVFLALEVCDDHANTEQLVFRGLREVVEDACLRILCDGRGLSRANLDDVSVEHESNNQMRIDYKELNEYMRRMGIETPNDLGNRRDAHGRHKGEMTMGQAPKVEGTSSGTSALDDGLGLGPQPRKGF